MKIKPFRRNTATYSYNGVTYFLYHDKNSSTEEVRRIIRRTMDNQIRVLSRLNKNTTVAAKLYNCGYFPNKESTNFFFCTEYFTGGTLSDLITGLSKEGTRLNEANCKRIFQELLSAVNSIHENNVAHLNLKPEHIMFNEKGELKLIGFQHSVITEAPKVRINTSNNGTCYNPPEFIFCAEPSFGEIKGHFKTRARGIRLISGKSADVFSLGVILFLMYFGRCPFQKSDSTDMSYMLIINEEYEKFWERVNEPVPKTLQMLITAMILYVPEERLTIKEIFNHPWLSQEQNSTKKHEENIILG